MKQNRIDLDDDGTHYYRADFQVHTPRDNQWGGARPKTDDERRQWAREFVTAARQRNLNAVAISDHHDFAMFPFVKEAADAELDDDGDLYPPKERLVVFPALELTLALPCQAILILDADFPTDRLANVLQALHHEPHDPKEAALPATTVLKESESVPELCAKLDMKDWLKGKYILLPNVTPDGHKSILRTSFQDKYKAAISVSVAGYIDGSDVVFEKKVGERLILEGKDKNWGDKHLPYFQTSDARSADFAKLGTVATWVKWSEPTAEALRQAGLAHESRISQVEPALPNVWISRVVVTASKFMGRLDVRMNPQYTAVIGGRGTGKSTILDYTRWALADQPAAPGEDDEVTDPRVRQRRLVDATLVPVGGVVEVHCVINEIPHIVRREAATGEFQLKVGDGQFEPAREAVVQSLLPIQAYSQKQLSSVAIRLDELTRFVTAPILRELDEIARRQEEVRGRLRENYATLQRFRSLEHDIEQSEVRIRSIAEQAQALRDGLTGLSDEERLILNEKAGYDAAAYAVQAWAGELAQLEQAVDDLEALAEATQQRIQLPDGVVPDAIRPDIDAAASEIQSQLARVRKGLAESGEALRSAQVAGDPVAVALAKVSERTEAFADQYKRVKERSTAHETRLQELASLETQGKNASELLRGQRTELGRVGQPGDAQAALRAELTALNTERSDALRAQCEQLSMASDGLIRSTLEVGRNFKEVQAKLRGLISGSGLRATKVEVMFDQLVQDANPIVTWETVLNELELVILLDPDADLKSEMTPTLARLGLTTQDIARVKPKLSADGWLDLSLTPLVDQPRFEYQSKPGTYIPFGSASAGQQATALLTTLLSQVGTPLMIDQPEEDLDSETVQQIVSKMWRAKGHRQLILASHNANLVVNGDADLVLVCGYTNVGDQSAGSIKLSGAIDQPNIRQAITRVMEGGETAFKLRKEKYGF